MGGTVTLDTYLQVFSLVWIDVQVCKKLHKYFGGVVN